MNLILVSILIIYLNYDFEQSLQMIIDTVNNMKDKVNKELKDRNILDKEEFLVVEITSKEMNYLKTYPKTLLILFLVNLGKFIEIIHLNFIIFFSTLVIALISIYSLYKSYMLIAKLKSIDINDLFMKTLVVKLEKEIKHLDLNNIRKVVEDYNKEILNKYFKMDHKIEIFKNDVGTFTASIKEFPGCRIEGVTEDDVYEKIKEAKRSWIIEMLEAENTIPLPENYLKVDGVNNEETT
jgi:predicted RNase H-like HicB family nuclease